MKTTVKPSFYTVPLTQQRNIMAAKIVELKQRNILNKSGLTNSDGTFSSSIMNTVSVTDDEYIEKIITMLNSINTLLVEISVIPSSARSEIVYKNIGKGYPNIKKKGRTLKGGALKYNNTVTYYDELIVQKLLEKAENEFNLNEEQKLYNMLQNDLNKFVNDEAKLNDELKIKNDELTNVDKLIADDKNNLKTATNEFNIADNDLKKFEADDDKYQKDAGKKRKTDSSGNYIVRKAFVNTYNKLVNEFNDKNTIKTNIENNIKINETDKKNIEKDIKRITTNLTKIGVDINNLTNNDIPKSENAIKKFQLDEKNIINDLNDIENDKKTMILNINSILDGDDEKLYRQYYTEETDNINNFIPELQKTIININNSRGKIILDNTADQLIQLINNLITNYSNYKIIKGENDLDTFISSQVDVGNLIEDIKKLKTEIKVEQTKIENQFDPKNKAGPNKIDIFFSNKIINKKINELEEKRIKLNKIESFKEKIEIKSQSLSITFVSLIRKLALFSYQLKEFMDSYFDNIKDINRINLIKFDDTYKQFNQRIGTLFDIFFYKNNNGTYDSREIEIPAKAGFSSAEISEIILKSANILTSQSKKISDFLYKYKQKII
jgi:hypothetical protein